MPLNPHSKSFFEIFAHFFSLLFFSDILMGKSIFCDSYIDFRHASAQLASILRRKQINYLFICEWINFILTKKTKLAN